MEQTLMSTPTKGGEHSKELPKIFDPLGFFNDLWLSFNFACVN
jgi:hypothetical protein